MRPLLLILLTIAVKALSQAQEGENVINQQGSIRVLPLFQRWSSDSTAFSEVSSVVSVYQPVSRSASISVSGSFGSTSGDVTSLSGATDVQISASYYLESANLIFSLGIGIPSGKKKLTADEFLTSALIANNVFRFQVPHFGTGFNLAPGVVWAVPLNDDLVLGLGATFQYRRPFSPLENFGSYDPGDEVSATLGLDVRIDETSSLSGDVLFTHYGYDKVNDLEVFASGEKVVAAIQFKKYFDRNELSCVATFRTKAKAEIAVGNLLVPLNRRVDPNQSEIIVAYMARFDKTFATQFLLEGRFFQETTAPLSGFNMLGIGIMPELALSESVRVSLRTMYVHGNSSSSGALSGVEAGVGLVVGY